MYVWAECVCFVHAGAVRVEREHGLAERALLVVSTDVQGRAVDPQLTAVLQWIAASIADLSSMQLSQFSAQELQQVRTFRIKVMHYNIVLLPKKVTNCISYLL